MQVLYRKGALILSLLLIVVTVISLCGCQASTKNATSTSSIAGYTPSEHFEQRLIERNISIEQVKDVLTNGEHYYDPKHDSHIRYKDGIYVALTSSKVIKTVIRGPVESRWRRE